MCGPQSAVRSLPAAWRLLLEILRIHRDVVLPLVGCFVEREDCFDGTGRYAGAAIDALVGMNVEHLGGREIGFDHVESAMAALAGMSGGADIPGGRVELRRGRLVLIQQKPVPK